MGNRRLLLEWPELNKRAYATLADDKNPELCDEIWEALPFESIMNNAVITDGSMYCWVPMLSFAPVRYKERIDLAPAGRLRYSQNTGNKIIVQYDACNEDILGAVLGQIDEEDMETIKQVGQMARNAIFMTKKEIHVRIRRAEDENENPQRKDIHQILKQPKACRPEVQALAEELLMLAEEASHCEPPEHKSIRLGKNSGMGSCGQYFSTWEFVYSLSRDVSMYTLYPIARLCRNDQFDVRQLEQIFTEIIPTYTNLLGSYGMKRLRRLVDQFRTLISEKTLTREEFCYILDALVFYTDMIAQWSYFYYPWGIGCACFQFDEEHLTYIPDRNESSLSS